MKFVVTQVNDKYSESSVKKKTLGSLQKRRGGTGQLRGSNSRPLGVVISRTQTEYAYHCAKPTRVVL